MNTYPRECIVNNLKFGLSQASFRVSTSLPVEMTTSQLCLPPLSLWVMYAKREPVLGSSCYDMDVWSFYSCASMLKIHLIKPKDV